MLQQLGQQNAVEVGRRGADAAGRWCRCAWPASSTRSSNCAAMPIRGSSGNQLRLGDIAEIKRGYVDPPAVKVRHQGKEVIALGVSMAKGGDIIRLGKALQGAVDAHRGRAAGRHRAGAGPGPAAARCRSSVNEFVQRADRGRG